MGTPDTPAANPAEKVNKVLSEIPTTDDGKLDFTGIEISDEMRAAVNSEKRRRDTQAAYTKTQQSLKLKEAEIEALKTLIPNAISDLPTEERERLDVLKYQDPEAWRVEMNKVDMAAQAKAKEVADEAISSAQAKASTEFTLSERAQQLDEFNKANPETPLTDEQLAYDIPPRLTKQLEDGKISFGELLVKAHDFINSGKAINNPKNSGQPSLGKEPSGSGKQTTETLKSSYEEIIF